MASQPTIKYFTSHYGRVGLPGKRTLAITPVIPRGYHGAVERRLAPSTNMLRLWREVKSPAALDNWRQWYFSLIGQKIAPADAALAVDGRILLAHEATTPSFRHLLRDWFEFYGYTVETREWGGETADDIDQRSFPFAMERKRP